MTPGLNPRLAAPLLLVAASGIAASWAAEHSSVQRGNRLQRAGELPAAVQIYAARARADSGDYVVRYNLGTTRLQARSPRAAPDLAAGARAADLEVRVSSLYNLGLWGLLRALDAESHDSTRTYALASVEANKEVLRLSPGRRDAQWNLAIAQIMLDSVDIMDGSAGTESADGTVQPDEMTRTDETLEVQEESPAGDGPQDGQEEALGDLDDGAPLTTDEADEILGSGHLDASPMIRKLLAFEGRTQRRTRLGRTTPRW